MPLNDLNVLVIDGRHYLRHPDTGAQWTEEVAAAYEAEFRAMYTPPPVVEVPASPEPEVAYRTLDRLEFVTLIQTVAGIDDATLMECRNDAALAPLWFKLTQLVSSVRRDHPLVGEGLKALKTAGYLDKAAVDAIMKKWPVVA